MFTVNDLKEGLIYKYTCPEGKIYIGQTYNEKKRISEHKRMTIKDPTSKFGEALRKFGYENFKYEVILKFNPTLDLVKLKRVLHKLERRYIKLYNSDIEGYNITKGGEGVLGLKHTEEIKKQMRESRLGHLVTKETRLKISEKVSGKNKGKVHSEEQNKLMSDLAKNKKEVIQLDLEGNIINTFNCIANAARSIEDSLGTQKTKSNRISEVCQGKRKTIFGYVWKFKED